ncbi:hypothetical protein LWI29_037982 [Acer saccharum]|uniref:Uncharacterized protein n=1 Tax=Acer saccharum TaxID=4024 RepID=A0AA39SZU1_ACESA|nr:hypothetical protein LWI29_037982 [Acer saccharum]KAK1574869.1 hypothetical protein Q3G72_000614 [Acer saccharum]
MPRSLFLNLSKSATTIHRLSPSRLVPLRAQSSQPDLPDHAESSSSTDPLLSKLEDAIHRIIARRSAPDWLPFLPGYSYWVPPPTSQFYGVAQLVEKLANPLTHEQSMSTNSARGWPSSEFFIRGAGLHPVDLEMTSANLSQSESESDDEEG